MFGPQNMQGDTSLTHRESDAQNGESDVRFPPHSPIGQSGYKSKGTAIPMPIAQFFRSCATRKTEIQPAETFAGEPRPAPPRNVENALERFCTRRFGLHNETWGRGETAL